MKDTIIGILIVAVVISITTTVKYYMRRIIKKTSHPKPSQKDSNDVK